MSSWITVPPTTRSPSFETRHPDVRIISYSSNRGFAEAYNAAAALCQTEFVAFLNNDTRVAPGWLMELMATANRHGAACAASRILDWTGERIDFAGGYVSFLGHSWQRDAGQPATKEYGEDRLLFACGGSMLVNRATFLDAGGFDPQFFAYFEDVDLGWRLSLLGHTTVFAPAAVTYHRLHGTAGRWAAAPRLRLYERNALMMIYKNYERETLARVFPVAVALALARACAHTALDPRTFEFGNRIPDRVPVSPRTIAQLIGLEDFACQLPLLAEKRQEIQRRRQRTDRELFPLFSDPLRLHDIDTQYEADCTLADCGVRDRQMVWRDASRIAMPPVGHQPWDVDVDINERARPARRGSGSAGRIRSPTRDGCHSRGGYAGSSSRMPGVVAHADLSGRESRSHCR